MNTENIRDNAERVIEDLTRLRDEARVRLNLLGKELRDRWTELDRQVDEVVRQAKNTSEQVLDRACALREELRKELWRSKDAPPPPSAPVS